MCRIAGRLRNRHASVDGAVVEIPAWSCFNSNVDPMKLGNGQWQSGSLTGAVSSQRVTEELQWYTQPGRQSGVERKGRSVLDCETHKSSRYESRP